MLKPRKKRRRTASAEAYEDAADTAEFIERTAEARADGLARQGLTAAAQCERAVTGAMRCLARILRDRASAEPTQVTPRASWWRRLFNRRRT